MLDQGFAFIARDHQDPSRDLDVPEELFEPVLVLNELPEVGR
jgi:hypothetical protein